MDHSKPAAAAKQITFVSVSVVQDSSSGGFSDAWDDFEDARTIWSFFSLLSGLHLRNYFSNQTPTSFELLSGQDEENIFETMMNDSTYHSSWFHYICWCVCVTDMNTKRM